MQVIVTSERDLAHWVGDALAFAARRFGMLAVALAVLAAVLWAAPLLGRAPVERVTPALPTAADLAPVEAEIKWGEVNKTMPEAAPVLAHARPLPARRRAIPLDAPHEAALGDDFDILSAPELAAISQAQPE